MQKTAAQTSLCLWTDTGALVPFICGVQEEEKGVPADLISLHLYEFQKALGNLRFLDPFPSHVSYCKPLQLVGCENRYRLAALMKSICDC